MAYQWEVVISDAPHMHLYNDALGLQDHDQEDGENTYLTEAFLTPAHSIPGIPSNYAVEQSEGRALYIGGAPKSWTVLISLSAEETFRWVVMEDEDEAMQAMEQLHGRKHDQGYLVKKELLAEQPDLTTNNYDEAQKTPVPPLYHGHPPSSLDTSDERTPTAFDFKIPEIRTTEVDYEGDYNEDEDIHSPEIPQPSQCTPVTSPAKDDKKDTFVTQASSWANIARANADAAIIDLKPEHRAGPRLKPVGRIPNVTRTVNHDLQRLVFLFNLPITITAENISDAVKEGPIVKMQFGYDADSKARYCGVIFQYARDAAAFQETLDREKRESKPERFRFIVEHARSEQPGLEDTLKAMGPPMFATRRLTIVKAGFFFMFGERQLRDLCEKLVGADAIQLIWLYNGGNATVVFTDVSAAIKVKREFDRKAARAAEERDLREDTTEVLMNTPVWAGVQTTFSKDPCVQPLELKSTMY